MQDKSEAKGTIFFEKPKGCKLTKTEKGYIITTPSGDRIPNITKGSIRISQDDEKWVKAGLCRVSVELLIWRKDMEGVD